MLAKSLLLLVLAGCSAERAGVAQEALGGGGSPSIFELAAGATLALPPFIPDDLLEVKDPYRPDEMVSLRAGAVVGAWTTVPDSGGDPPILVYQCRPDPGEPGLSTPDAGDLLREYTWVVVPHATLAPIGVDAAALATALPYEAEHERAEATGIYQVAPSGPAWTVAGQVGVSASARTVRTGVIGAIDGTDLSQSPDSIQLYRYRKAGAVSTERLAVPTIDRADYVLRLDTLGGLGPDEEGAPCDPGSLDESSAFTADFYFVAMPWSYIP